MFILALLCLDIYEVSTVELSKLNTRLSLGMLWRDDHSVFCGHSLCYSFGALVSSAYHKGKLDSVITYSELFCRIAVKYHFPKVSYSG